jgi:flavin reductase (DIM6/NTAB) family NADH-FMN oxidoreductase RutF
MGQFPTGVCVVAANRDDGGIAAMTINSFVSVSLEPLLVCWSLHNNASQFDHFAGAGCFTVSILGEDQGEHAKCYAARGDSRMRPGDFVRSEQGLPVIDGALGHFECRSWSTYPAGDHTMILGEVTGLSQRVEPNARALGFFNGQFCAVPGDAGSGRS